MSNPFQNAALEDVLAAWRSLQAAQKDLADQREIFLSALMKAEKAGCTQDTMASVCLTDAGHISRSRISQYVLETRHGTNKRSNKR